MVLAVTSPLKIGVYENESLVEEIVSEEKTSEILPELFKELAKKYEIKGLFYAKGPGSFMAIKISYIFLKTFSIVKNIPFYAADAFNFNENSPVKALGKLYFVKENGIIRTKKLELSSKEPSLLKIPPLLNKSVFDEDTEPLYILPAV